MKILIEESVLRQALETFTHCYAETDRRINERAKLLVELRTSLDAAEKVEPVAWIITTDNTNLHQLDPNRENNWLAFDVNQFKNDSARALVISNTQPLYLHPAIEAAEKVEPVAWLYYENGEECFGHPDGYRPDDAVALYTLEGIKK